jgi:hypothetical protein
MAQSELLKVRLDLTGYLVANICQNSRRYERNGSRKRRRRRPVARLKRRGHVKEMAEV